MADRYDSLENKTIYLVDTGFGGSSRFMIQLQQWFRANMLTVKTSSSIDKWRVNRSDMCADGSCGLPDAPVEYD